MLLVNNCTVSVIATWDVYASRRQVTRIGQLPSATYSNLYAQVKRGVAGHRDPL